MFSFGYILDVSRLFFQCPSAITMIGHGSEDTGNYIQRRIKQKWLKQKIVKRNTHGFEIYLNLNDSGSISPNIAIAGTYEPHITRLFRKLVRPGMVVIDVGANIGWYTLMAANLTAGSGLVISLEPDPTTFSLLVKSVHENSFSNVKPIEKCASDSIGHATLFLSEDENKGANSIVRQIGKNRKNVPAITIDKLLDDLQISGVGLIKIDAEGAEPLVLEGLSEHLPRTRSIILEWNNDLWDQHGTLLACLSRYYNFYEISRSPFLIKKIPVEVLYKTKKTRKIDVYLQNKMLK